MKKVNGIICFVVNKGPEDKTVKWTIDLKNKDGSIEVNSKGTATYLFLLLCIYCNSHKINNKIKFESFYFDWK